MVKAAMKPVDLARATGLTPQNINSYLNEGRVPSLESLHIFANAFGVSIADLFREDKDPMPIIRPPHTIEDCFNEVLKYAKKNKPSQFTRVYGDDKK